MRNNSGGSLSIATVAEDTFLFSTTVAGNIAYGAPGATREDVVEAARKAQPVKGPKIGGPTMSVGCCRYAK